MRAIVTALTSLLSCGCAAHAPAPTATATAISPGVRFQVLGNASPSDTGSPTLRLEGQVVTIRGMALQVERGGLYGDVDLTEPHIVRLTLYDSLPGRPVDDPPPPSRYRQVVYQVEVGPLPPGPYDVWIGRFEPRGQLVEVVHEPLRIEVERTGRADSASRRP